MKITVEYQLPDDEYEYECMRNAEKYRTALFEVYTYFRSEYKYSDSDTIDNEVAYNHVLECIAGLDI